MAIPLVDLKAQYRSIKEQIDAAITEILENTSFIGGKPVSDFEKDFATYCEANYAVGTASGTAALHLALCAADIKAGDEVITVSQTFIATAEVVKLCGAAVRMVDIDPQSYCMDPDALEDAITDRTRAIIPVHLYGHPADMDPILKIAGKHGITVIEDSAQAHGARYNGRRAGSIAEIATFSFYPGKNLGAYGDAGALTLSGKETADKVTMLANHGRWLKYKHLIEGFNYRLDAIQAAVLSVKLRHIEEWTEKRRQVAARYDELLADLEEVTLPKPKANVEHVYHLYVVQVPNRDKVTEYLREHGVMAQLHYPIPLHLQPAYEHLGMKPGSLPATETLADRCISLPTFPELTEEQISTVAKTLKAAMVNA
ncbi:MAG: DegT/DnrJ/EryC1/StrS family aminotransferase [Candidatus Eisenbacteria sp.]|nr:DegT/DnrJ/EryC1/StrS family aminotransferase [Candidatus Eisenbacteria bacterium]